MDAQNEHGDVGRISSPISVANLGHMVVVDSLAVIGSWRRVDRGWGGDLFSYKKKKLILLF